ncbi:hypothetical protein Pfo_012645 [Paulownia fortunei]|nr:hypothetical protein Pfo_012645 [Paulownia fortunei]
MVRKALEFGKLGDKEATTLEFRGGRGAHSVTDPTVLDLYSLSSSHCISGQQELSQEKSEQVHRLWFLLLKALQKASNEALPFALTPTPTSLVFLTFLCYRT